MKRISQLSALIALVLALMAWVGVVLFAGVISRHEATYLTKLQDAQRAATVSGSAARIHALASDTAADRADLDHLLNVDVVSVAAMIQEVGSTTHVAMKLGGVSQEAAINVGGSAIQPIGFVVQADGTFAGLMRAIALLEKLPVPSSLARITLRTSGPGAATAWHMELYLRVLSNPTQGS